MRTLVLVLGDQLDLQSVLPAAYSKDKDVLWMAETAVEARRVWSHKARIALFLSAMRHFAQDCRSQGHTLIYATSAEQSIAQLLQAQLRSAPPQKVLLARPGDWHLLQELQAVLDASGLPWEMQEDAHFLTTPGVFARWAEGRKSLRMEYFYRSLRRRDGVLLEADGQPRGGRWNFDAENRQTFGPEGPSAPAPQPFPPDALTQQVLEDVEARHADHPGSLEGFDWPVTAADAERALEDFIRHRLPQFGAYQDAIWVGEAFLFHSRLAAAMNLHLLHPRRVIAAAVQALDAGLAPLAAVEGFVRQILGWREYVRGMYWLRMPQWQQENHLQAEQPLPVWYWTGDTQMACLKDALHSTLSRGYAHHIQRLMVTGLYGLLLGVRPAEIEAWYHAIYVDAVHWVELPNTLGMSQFVDGGVLASKPYVASGKYIQRMSNACAQCPYDPGRRSGEQACPFTVLYWDFLLRHQSRLQTIPRMRLPLRNLEGLDASERAQIQDAADTWRAREAQRCSTTKTPS